MKMFSSLVYRKKYTKIDTKRCMKIKLKILNRKIVKQGDSHFVYIPKAYFNNEQLSADEIYDIIIIIPQKKKVKEIAPQNQIKTVQEEGI